MGKNKGDIVAKLLFFFSIFYLFLVIYTHRDLYLEKFESKKYEVKYNQSQWVVPQSKKIISDEDLYAYAGYRYLKGLNPILVNPEVPPLGKYLIGISIAIFNNQRVLSMLAAFFCLAAVGYVGYFTSRSETIMSLAIFLTATNSLFVDQVIHAPQLDIFQLLFLLLFIIFYLFYLKKKNNFFLFLGGLAIGCFISTKFFLLSLVLINTSLLIYYIFNRSSIKKILLEFSFLNIVALLVYLLTYINYFLQGGTLIGFLGVQKWIFNFYFSSQIQISRLLGNYLSLIFLNRWRFWSNGYPIIHYQYWSILWPVIILFGIVATINLLRDERNRQKDLIFLLISFLLVYNIFLFITPLYPRYLLLLFVPVNILISLFFCRLKHPWKS